MRFDSARCAALPSLFFAALALGACGSSPPRPGSPPGETPAAAPEEAEPVSEQALAAHSRALAAIANERWAEAERELEALVLAEPALPGALVNLAIVYLHDGRVGEARAMLERALSVAPGHAAANNQLGILLRNEGRFGDAEAAYRRALATDPGYALAHYNLGVLLDVYLRRPAEALEEYELYQSAGEPDETVARWIVDLRRRLGLADGAPRAANEEEG
jgi:tetratricopeptide (TPR) repeat protein